MFCKPIFAPIFLLFFLLLPLKSKAMIKDEIDEPRSKHFMKKQGTFHKGEVSISKPDKLPHHFVDPLEEIARETFSCLRFNVEIPKEITIEIFSYLKTQDFFLLRGTSKSLKNILDKAYWKTYPMSIREKSSSPAIQDVKDIPFTTVSLSFEKWEQQDIEQLFLFNNVKDLRLAGLKSWDFSTGELFNPDPLSSCFSHILSIINTGLFNMFGMELDSPTIFANVTSLDLSDNSIGDYGVISFVAHFKKLQTLNISNNDIGNNRIGEVDAICNLNSLTSLNISKNNFSSETVKEMNQLTNLTSLDISHNFISDKIMIEKLSQLPKLISFRHQSQREQKNSNNCLPPFFYYPLLSRGGRLPF